MDFDLTPEQDELRSAVRAFAEEVVAPAAAEADERGAFPTEIVKRAAELGRSWRRPRPRPTSAGPSPPRS